jgi:CubicO group peptidase (beta-lactamase class C family)
MIQQSKPFGLTLTTRHCISFLLIFLLPVSVAAQMKKAAEIDAYVKPLVRVNQFSGVILASYKGKVIYEKAFGLAHAELGVLNRADTVFGIGSVTKPMTVTIALRLIEEGKLGRQDKLSKWLPDFPRGDQITVEMLMLHRSGIPHRGTSEERGEESLRYTAADMVEKAKKVPLEFQPGERESYSSLGYSVLARVLELAAGKNYAQLLQEYVFNPAEMKDSTDFNSETILPRRAQDYFLEPSGLVHTPLKDYSFLVGAGSVFSTAHDVYRFGESVLDGTYGTSVQKQLVEEGVFGENGVTNGFRCYVWVQKEFGFVVISNLQSGANDLLVRDLRNMLQDKPVSPPSPPNFSFSRLSAEQLKEYVGVYKFPNFTNEVVLTGDQLISGDYKIYPIGKDRFFRLADYSTLIFVRNADGTIKGLVWQGVRGKWEGVR